MVAGERTSISFPRVRVPGFASEWLCDPIKVLPLSEALVVICVRVGVDRFEDRWSPKYWSPDSGTYIYFKFLLMACGTYISFKFFFIV